MENNALYSFAQLVEIFDLAPGTTTVSAQDIRICKRKVMMMHPDKSSHLPASYFLAYKNALDQLVKYYHEFSKTTRAVPHEQIIYDQFDDAGAAGGYLRTEEQRKEYNREFNELFDRTFNTKEGIARAAERNSWFYAPESPNTAAAAAKVNIKNTQHLAAAIESFRNRQSDSRTLVVNTANAMLHLPQSGGTSIYDTPDTLLGDREDANTLYIDSSDVFAQLRYDDLRRVHNDETVFSVTESDIAHQTMSRANNVEDIKAARRNDRNLYLSAEEENTLYVSHKAQLQKEMEILAQKQLFAAKQAQMNDAKSQSVLAHFRRIQF